MNNPPFPPSEPVTVEQGRRMNKILDNAVFLGMQSDERGNQIELWNLLKQVGVHPKGSTVSRQTLDRLLFT
jgi:hypothetical protein